MRRSGKALRLTTEQLSSKEEEEEEEKEAGVDKPCRFLGDWRGHSFLNCDCDLILIARTQQASASQSHTTSSRYAKARYRERVRGSRWSLPTASRLKRRVSYESPDDQEGKGEDEKK